MRRVRYISLLFRDFRQNKFIIVEKLFVISKFRKKCTALTKSELKTALAKNRTKTRLNFLNLLLSIEFNIHVPYFSF